MLTCNCFLDLSYAQSYSCCLQSSQSKTICSEPSKSLSYLDHHNSTPSSVTLPQEQILSLANIFQLLQLDCTQKIMMEVVLRWTTVLSCAWYFSHTIKTCKKVKLHCALYSICQLKGDCLFVWYAFFLCYACFWSCFRKMV